MDEATKQVLDNIQHSVPRYLFRVWTTNKAWGTFGVSGGFEGLNTDSAITPLAFYNGGGNANIYELTREELRQMVSNHLFYSLTEETQFSSWSASLGYVLSNYARWRSFDFADQYLDHVYIGVVDTKHSTGNSFFHVPLLCFFGVPGLLFNYEYLADGVISGEAYKAVPLRCFVAAGVTSNVPSEAYNAPSDMQISPGRPITRDTLARARQVGERYGQVFSLPVTLAILCIVRRDPELFTRGIPRAQRILIFNGIEGLPIPGDWRDDATIRTDIATTDGYGDTEQMIRLMRAIAETIRA